jgi:transcriptional regulator with XRE-family HTH domain
MPPLMSESTPNPEAGKRLRAERVRSGLSTRDVQKLSQQIAQEKGNPEYYISHAWLTDVENGKFTPGIYKFYSLSLIYKCNYLKILGLFGINVLDAAREMKLVSQQHTHLIGSSIEMLDAWGEIPPALLQQLDLRHSLCGYIGLEDYTLYPIIRPGSFVEIDSRQNKIAAGNWQSEHDRPIYFVELRNGYACNWCEVDANQLILIPSPQSRAPIRRLRYPNEAEIIGRVTAVTMRIAQMDEISKAGSHK